MIILTVDYEIFGNGSGCIGACVAEPAERMMSIADRFDSPLTFFVETLEFMAMENAEISDAEIARKQIRDAVKDGHDAQLHLHPQWENSEYTEGKSWKLDMSSWRIGDLGQDRMASLLRSGMSWLQDLMNGIPAYRCIAFRAGGWCIQPSAHVLKELRKAGILVDSTVAPGAVNFTAGEWSDFRNAPDRPYWKADSDVCMEAVDGIWELPIATGNVNPMRHLKAIRDSRASGNGGFAPGCAGSYGGPAGRFRDKLGKIDKLFRLGRVMLDFSTMPAEVLIEVTQSWLKRFGREAPVVAIAHTKNFTPMSEKALAAYLEWASAEGISFGTYGQWLERMHG